MCGIVGVLNLHEQRPIPKTILPSMLGTIRHRGPDEFGIYRDQWVNLGNARLCIIDLKKSQNQAIYPIADGIVYQNHLPGATDV